MIRPSLLTVLALTAASAVTAAQSSNSTSAPMSPSIACPTETGPPSKTPHKWVSVSAGVMARNRVGGKDPKYPSDAKRAQIDGRVVLEATISDSGKVEDLCVSQGPAMLQQASVDAVKTWRYKPFELNGQPVEVKTQINVDFTLR
jgi:TonB family protein